EYRAFLAARRGDTSGQPPECAWNERFDPELYDPTDPNFDDPDTHDKCGVQTWAYLEAHPNQPAACVDFCDAFAYCSWAGKRLCGRAGADGTKVVRASTAPSGGYDADLFAQSFELYRACTQGGSTAYPYGDAASPGLCKDSQWLAAQGLDSMAVEPVGGQCHGTESPYDQLYDLAGSVSEWGNLSVPYGRVAVLNIERQHVADQAKCDTAFGWAGPSSLGPGLGIRCCAAALFEGSER
ncbi:MAG: SUMF1/EgtB/PvdO family nonheme iron enzyme, partial [Polyangiaceae bacterium]|nr:SUMF1/EgtB/PvdO family nonheme iron enzyme [Polyangiaceae bacterium]